MPRRVDQTCVILVLLASGPALLGGCGGESQEEQAQAAVCDARGDIAAQVDRLAALTITTATVDQVRDGLQAIQDDLETIADNRDELSDDRRQEVESATSRFTGSVREIAGDVGSSLSLDDAGAQLRAALTELGDAYESTLAQVDCD